MADSMPQNFANHRRYVPLFHFFLGSIVPLYFLWSIRRVIKYPTYDHASMLVEALALLLMFWYVRSFPETVQDRIIRLEETLRLQKLAPDLAARTGEFTRGQWVGLRFASDEELPALARKVLEEKITGRDAIKKLVKNWRPDYFRV